MALSNNFSEYYKTISNAELLSILEKPTDYQDAAIEAANKEFSDRQLSAEEIKEARQVLFEKRIEKIKQREKAKAVENNLKKTGQTVFDNINPFRSGVSPTEKNIRIIIIAFSVLFLYQFINEFKTIIFYIKGMPRFPFENGLYLLPQLLLPIATFLFWKRKMIGWILLAAFVTFSIVITVVMVIQSFFWSSSGFTALDNLLPRPSTTDFLVPLILFTWTLYVLCKTAIREVFSISDQKIIATISISGLVTLVLMFI